ncbi:MAG: biotin/lipoyl-containing protein [Candidatus Limnocylindria bacterium]
MSDLELRIDGRTTPPAEGWSLDWVDRAAGIARLTGAGESLLVVVEGSGTQWQVAIRGRRVAVAALTWRERMLADAAVATTAHGGPLEVRASLPGLVVAVAVEVGGEVAEGDRLLTIEAMKMQNEVRAPRAGRVSHLAVAPGQPVATGAVLLRLE